MARDVGSLTSVESGSKEFDRPYGEYRVAEHTHPAQVWKLALKFAERKPIRDH
jgi:hypothetical protein